MLDGPYCAGRRLAAAALALSFGAPPASAQDTWMRSYCSARTSSSTSSCPRHVASRRAPPAMIQRSAGPSRSRTSTRRRSGHRVLSRVRLAAGSLRTTAYVQGFLGVYTPGALRALQRRAAPSGTGAPRAAAHRPTIPTARWGTATFSETITPDDVGWSLHTRVSRTGGRSGVESHRPPRGRAEHPGEERLPDGQDGEVQGPLRGSLGSTDRLQPAGRPPGLPHLVQAARRGGRGVAGLARRQLLQLASAMRASAGQCTMRTASFPATT